MNRPSILPLTACALVLLTTACPSNNKAASGLDASHKTTRDAGPTSCPEGQQCGSACCTVDEQCVSGQCQVCDCAGATCGVDNCGNPCGDCSGTQVCDPGTGHCVDNTCPSGAPCSGTCCTADQTCVAGVCTAGAADAGCGCGTRVCGTDGCGTSCGSCTAPQTCDLASGACVDTCASGVTCNGNCCAAGQSCVGTTCQTCGCGTKICGTDACGNSCGSCTAPQTCDNQTGTCQNSCTGTVCNGTCCASGDSCVGNACCPSGQVCTNACCTAGQSCVAGACKTCGCGTKVCGTDGCGTSCGNCLATQTCNGSGQCVNNCPTGEQACNGACCTSGQTCITNQCETCGCGTKTCGSDACGNACGVCTAPLVCGPSGQCACPSGQTSCGSACCTAGQTCVGGTSCQTCTCGSKVCGADNCGNSCGSCTSPATCDSSGQCTTTCASGVTCNGACCNAGESCVGNACCSTAQTCGSGSSAACCTAGQSCIGGTTCQTCGCGTKTCGSDACGLSCGSCTAPKTCDGTGTCACPSGESACGASACCASGETCIGNACCPSTQVCGTSCCTSGQTCAGTCQTCGCNGKVCGLDACGNSCGACTAPLTCDGTGQCSCPTAQSCGSSCCASGQSCVGGTTCCASTQACGSSCCASGQKCVGVACCPAAQACGSTCCGSGQTCVSGTCGCTTSPDSCAKASAGAQMCDQVSRTCVSATVTCGSGTCAAGQACVLIADLAKDDGSGGYVDPYTASGTKACSCVPAGYSASHPVDSCEAAGKICNDSSFNPSSPTAMTCRNPVDGEDCLNGLSTCTGTGITCETLAFSDGSADMCVQKCTASSACPALTDTCQTEGGVQICWNAICAQPWAEDYVNQKGTETTSERGKYYAACNLLGTGDGTCLPYSFEGYDASGTLTFLDIGVCVQNGTSSTSKCDVNATRANLSLACPAGTSCDQVLAQSASPNGVCRTTCNAAPSASPAHACTSGYCYDTSIGPLADYYCTTYSEYCDAMQAERLGVCEPSCNQAVSPSGCPTTDPLGNTYSCAPYDWATGNGYCQGILPGSPTTEKASCTLPATNAGGCGNASSSKSRTCYYSSGTATTGTCQTWCDYDTGTGCPSGESCAHDSNYDSLGLCL